MMRLYIKGYSSYREGEEYLDIKQELKQIYKLDTRRQDDFIHLAVYGAQKLKERVQINIDDELYITSGAGNLDILARVNNNVYEEKQGVMPFDFINMLGNTTSYYVATSLGIKGKNIFQISNHFTYINSLISIYASLHVTKNDAIFGSIDLVGKNDEVLKRVLGVEESCEVVSCVNYQKLSLDARNAIAQIEFDTKNYSYSEIEELQNSTEREIIFSARCTKFTAVKNEKFFENMIHYTINKYIQNTQNLIYIDCFEDSYKVIKLNLLEAIE